MYNVMYSTFKLKVPFDWKSQHNWCLANIIIMALLYESIKITPPASIKFASDSFVKTYTLILLF